jgi:hypothetical protein
MFRGKPGAQTLAGRTQDQYGTALFRFWNKTHVSHTETPKIHKLGPMQADKSSPWRLVVFCEPPPFNTEGLHDEGFLFLVCSGRSEFLSCQLLRCDVIIMTVGHANCDHARSCAGLRLCDRSPLLVVMADEPTAVLGSLRPDAVVPERATAS